MRIFEPVQVFPRNTSFIFLNMEVLQVNSPLSRVNGSEKKVYKVYVLKLDQYMANHVADSAFSEKKLGGAFEFNFCPKGREFEQNNLQKIKCPGDCPKGRVSLKLRINRRPKQSLRNK